MKKPAWISAPVICATLLGATAALANDGSGSRRDEDHPPTTTAAPTVRIVYPHDGTFLLAGTDVHICAGTRHFTNAVATVQFFAGTNSLGVVSNMFNFGDDEEEGGLFCLTWSNVPPAAYTLTALATDLAGTSATSAPVNVSVVTDLPPRVHIIHPHDGALILGADQHQHLRLCVRPRWDRD